MPTSTATPSSEGDRTTGFTLLELAVVLLVVAIVAAFLIPRFRDVESLRLAASADRLANTTRYLYEEAAFRQRPLRLNLDLDAQTYWVTTLDTERDPPEFVVDTELLSRPVVLPEGVAFQDVVLPALGTVTDGVVFAEFDPAGYVDPLVVHLQSRRGAETTLAIEPLTGRARVAEGRHELTGLKNLRGGRTSGRPGGAAGLEAGGSRSGAFGGSAARRRGFGAGGRRSSSAGSGSGLGTTSERGRAFP
jgi:prepilin-type N-terminal cleavage/methylation domain-containing protein